MQITSLGSSDKLSRLDASSYCEARNSVDRFSCVTAHIHVCHFLTCDHSSHFAY